MKILLLEDDEMLQETLKELLEDEGYDVDVASTSDEVLDLTFENSYDLYVFDIGVPGMDGTELLRALREGEDTTPTIFVSARVDMEWIAKGFKSGAFDYIKKPFYPEELLIRIKSRLDRDEDDVNDFIECGRWRYYPNKHILEVDGESIALSGNAEKIVSLLFESKGQVVDRDVLLDVLNKPSDVALRVAINSLRKKTNLPIKSIRGVGYILEEC